MRIRSSSTTPGVARLGVEVSAPARPYEALIALLVIATATVLVYSNTFDASFHLDDKGGIVRNQTLRDFGRFWPPAGNRYLGLLSFAINYRLGGLEVFGYHLVNLLIHAGNGLLVFWLTAITLRTPAMRHAETGPLVRRYLPLTAGLLFAVHPLATQAVTYISQRFASLATLFFLLSLVFYAKARLLLEAERSSKARAACLYCLSLVAAAAAMKTKEISFTLPFVAAGYEWIFFRPRRRLILLGPLAATALLIPIGLAAHGQGLGDVLGDAGSFAAESPYVPRSVYLLTEPRVVVRYLRLLLFPVGQNFDYDFPVSHSITERDVLLALAVLLAVASAAVAFLVRSHRTNRAAGMLVFFGIAWLFVTLSVESSVIPITDVIFEHRMYLPSAGAVVALSTALLWGVERLSLRVSPVLQVGVALLVTAGPLGVATYARNFVWKDDLTLWSDVVAKSPGNVRARHNLGFAYEVKGQLDDAIRQYQEGIRLTPEAADAHYTLGNAYRATGRLGDAAREFREAIRLDPRHTDAHNNLGGVAQVQGRFDEAIHEYLEATRLDPSMAEAHYNLASIFWKQGRPAAAAEEYRRAFELKPVPEKSPTQPPLAKPRPRSHPVRGSGGEKRAPLGNPSERQRRWVCALFTRRTTPAPCVTRPPAPRRVQALPRAGKLDARERDRVCLFPCGYTGCQPNGGRALS